MSLSSLGQLAVLNRQRRAAKEKAATRPILKPVQIQVANEPIQLIHDLMRLSLSSATKSKTRSKKKSENLKTGEDLNSSFKEIEHEQSSSLSRRHVATTTAARTYSAEKEAAVNVQNKKNGAGNESPKEAIAEKMLLRPASQCTSRHRRQDSLTVHNKGLAVRQEEGNDDQESEDELRLKLSLSEDELRLELSLSEDELLS
jgi:hypothetical protein